MYCFLSFLIYSCVAALCVKVYWKLATKWNGSYTCLAGKTVIVTGANTGLGYFTALDFAKRGARVILACRSRSRAEDAHRKIITATGNTNVVVKLVDFRSLQSIRDFAKDINENEERLDILVNNAGLGFFSEELYTADRLQLILQVNHISPFLLTHLLVGKLKQSAPSRIVNVASMAAKRAQLTVQNLDKLNAVPPITTLKVFRDSAVYSNSKLCNILFTIELAKKLENSGVTVNTLHPGVIYTEFFRDVGGLLKMSLATAGKFLLMSPEEGAQTQIYLSVSRDVENVSGGLFANCRQIELYSTAKDADLAKNLWKESEELAKLHSHEILP